jgi:hypothetical protein
MILDWAQLADEAMANADIDHKDILPDPPEVIIIDDGDDTPLPPPVKQTLQYLPKIEQGSILPSSSQPSHHYPTRIQTPPKHFGFDHDHVFTTMADNDQNSYLYIDASGKTDDLAFKDKITIKRVCHYIMLHCAKSTFVGNPNNKKQYDLKAGLNKTAERGNKALMKELRQFHVLRLFFSQGSKNTFPSRPLQRPHISNVPYRKIYR